MLIVNTILTRCRFVSSLVSVQFRRTYANTQKVMIANSTMKCREKPELMKLDTPEFKSLFTDELNKLKELFEKHGYEIRLAGGPVRDLLSGLVPKDLDFATTATPSEMKEMFNEENVRLINTNGEKHGTITPRINDKENYEITTLRIDVVTDGRRAEVKFTSDWKLDANRRDLTINSMFLGLDGTVYDYFYGYEDLMDRKILFVGDPDIRIKEDYLRILRYFRFYGRIAKDSNAHDENTLVSIKDNVDGLKNVSGERIWMELKKTLAGNFAGELLKVMLQLGIGKYIGLPESPNLSKMEELWKIAHSYNLQPMTLLSSLLNNLDDAERLNNRLKLSTFDRDLAYFIVEHRYEKYDILSYKKLLALSTSKLSITRQYIGELLKYKNNMSLNEEFNKWEVPIFYHISVDLLNKNNVTHPRHYGIVIKQLKSIWADHNFNITLMELEKTIPDILIKINNFAYKKSKKIKISSN